MKYISFIYILSSDVGLLERILCRRVFSMSGYFPIPPRLCKILAFFLLYFAISINASLGLRCNSSIIKPQYLVSPSMKETVVCCQDSSESITGSPPRAIITANIVHFYTHTTTSRFERQCYAPNTKALCLHQSYPHHNFISPLTCSPSFSILQSYLTSALHRGRS